MTKCVVCQAEIDFEGHEYFRLYSAEMDYDEYFCSPSCLVEGTWKKKDAKKKLSKSKPISGLETI